jgi:hypothetical protein
MRPCCYKILASFNQISPRNTCIWTLCVIFAPGPFVHICMPLAHAAGRRGHAGCMPLHATRSGWPAGAQAGWPVHVAGRRSGWLAGACTKMHI